MNKNTVIDAIRQHQATKAEAKTEEPKVETFAQWFKRECNKPLRYTITAEATNPEVRLILQQQQGKSYLRVFTDVIEARVWFKDNVIKFNSYEAYVDRGGRLNIFINAVLKQQPKPKAEEKPHQLTM